MGKDILIKLENIWKVFEMGETKLTALRGINLEITRGAFMTLMGPSGSGKSTLLYIIGCLDIPSKGKIYLDSEDVSGLSEDELAQVRGKKIGFIFQQFNLLSNLNSLENVMLPMVFQGVPEETRREKGEELLSSIGLKDRAKHKPPELSGGERQRVAIARALANDPDIIVADEPTGNLDSSTGKKIMEVLINLHKNKHKTIIVVTHDPNIASYSEQIINIMDGQISTNHKAAGKVLWER